MSVSVDFVTCPKQGREMEAVVLHRVGFLAYSCPKQGQDFKASAASLYPNMGQVPPSPPGGRERPRNSTKLKNARGTRAKLFVLSLNIQIWTVLVSLAALVT